MWDIKSPKINGCAVRVHMLYLSSRHRGEWAQKQLCGHSNNKVIFKLITENITRPKW